MLKPIVTSILLALASGAWAQTAPQVIDINSPEFQKRVEAEKAQTAPLNVTAETVGSDLSPQERKRLEELANAITDKTMQRYQQEGKQFEKQAIEMKRRVDDIADEALAGQRDKVLKFLGINPQGDGALYYFVSFSMPLEMIRSYVLEAMWSGGTVVVRGLPKGRTMRQFFTEDLRQLIYGKGAAANISLDPRLFEAYDVQAVPSIVYTEDRRQLSCTGVAKTKLPLANGDELNYDACPPVSSDKYWKISGAVTSDYALRAFIDQGAKGATAFHNALRKGAAPGMTIPKDQQKFTGEWKDAISPEQVMAQRQAIEEARQKQEANQQSATTPSQSVKP
jgi:type-F conjugative transfer system pilin assembly protein TrbC